LYGAQTRGACAKAMTELPYSCDPSKAASNLKVHHVTFDDGYSVLKQDQNSHWEWLDLRDEHEEDRWITIGPLPDASIHSYTSPGPNEKRSTSSLFAE